MDISVFSIHVVGGRVGTIVHDDLNGKVIPRSGNGGGSGQLAKEEWEGICCNVGELHDEG